MWKSVHTWQMITHTFSCGHEEDSSKTVGRTFHIRKKSLVKITDISYAAEDLLVSC